SKTFQIFCQLRHPHRMPMWRVSKNDSSKQNKMLEARNAFARSACFRKSKWNSGCYELFNTSASSQTPGLLFAKEKLRSLSRALHLVKTRKTTLQTREQRWRN